MADNKWKSWIALLIGPRKRRSAPARRTTLNVEVLEDRWVPSGSPTVNLTAPDTIGMVNGAIFRQTGV